MPSPFGSSEWELYNIKDDPGELFDLSEQYPERRERMIAAWEQYKIDNGVLDISMDLSGLQ